MVVRNLWKFAAIMSVKMVENASNEFYQMARVVLWKQSIVTVPLLQMECTLLQVHLVNTSHHQAALIL